MRSCGPASGAPLIAAGLTLLLAAVRGGAQERLPEGNRVTIGGTVVDAVSRRPIEGVIVQINYMGYVVETGIMDPIVVSVERREIALQDAGYYNRLEEGFGAFIDRAEIESRAPPEMSDIFSRIPGVELFADPDNPLEKYIVLRGGRQASFSAGPYGRCFPRVVLDGLVINRGGDEPAQLDRMLDPVAIAGVEVFTTSSGVPARYGGVGSSCGVILIWTRR